MERISKNKYKIDKHSNRNDNKEKKKLTTKQKVIIVLSIIVSIFAIFAIVFGTYVYKADGSIANAAINMMADVVGDDTPITVLVLGISEGIDIPLTDTILLGGYNPKTQKAFMVSIPRDTYIGTNDNYADGYSKINSAYQKGVEKTVSHVEKLTGIEINHYVVVKTSALVQIVDAIGGVEFDVPIDMDYDDPTQNLHIHLKAGMQLIDGAKAEQLLRFRHNNDGSSYPTSYGDNDYGRMRTQREFIKATAAQIIKWDNLTKIKDIISAIFDNLETDMSLTKMIGYIPSILKFDMANLQMQQLPGQSERINNLWFYTHNLSKTKILMTEFMQSLALEEKTYNDLYTPISTVSKRIRKVEEEEVENTVEEDLTTLACNHVWNTVIEKQATCREKGKSKLTCSLCNQTKTETIDKKSHEGYEKEIGREDATIVESGTIYYQCTAAGCDATWTEEIPKKEPPATDDDKEEGKPSGDGNGGEPANPSNPTTPSNPTNPSTPTNPSNPTEPVDPVTPGDGTTVETPSEPPATQTPGLSPDPGAVPDAGGAQ